MQVALVVSEGVSADECEAFSAVFGQVAGCDVVAVGEAVGPVAGPGGGWSAGAVFADVTAPDIVLVPGGLGCARTASDRQLLDWLVAVAPRARWLVASSTGTVVVAATGLLDRHEAATHWLAGSLLESYGSPASADRIVQVGRVITCAGHITAMHVALVVIGREFGAEAMAAARTGVEAAAAASRGDGPSRRPRRRRDRRPRGPARPVNRQLVAPDDIVFDEPVVTRMR